MSSTRADHGISGSLAGLRLCMVMHAGNRSRVSRVTRPAGPPARLGNRPAPVHGCPQRMVNRSTQASYSVLSS